MRELEEMLGQFPENYIVMIPDEDGLIGYTSINHIAKGLNDECGYVFICDYMEED